VILAALKTVMAGEMLPGSSKLQPVNLLGRLAPLAAMQCLAINFATRERIYEILGRPELYLTDVQPMAVIVLSKIFSL
jgi:hypothetical protein